MNFNVINDTKEFDLQYHYDGTDLGACVTKCYTSFKVWAPTASNVNLLLYSDGMEQTLPKQIIQMTVTKEGVWEYGVEDNLDGTYYNYEVTALGETHITGDIYAKACGPNGIKSMVVDLTTTNPEGFNQDTFVYDFMMQPIIYEVHIKDFSYDQSSGVESKYQGKYLAFTELGTCIDLDRNKPTCVDYLKKLGITHVHILPMYDFGSIDELGDHTQFNWGYDPVNYNCLEGSYATDVLDGKVRIREMKKMVQALHKAGMGVIMDVVYNHTYTTDSYFQWTVPFYYYRTNEDGSFANGSDCSNETASERSMFRKYIIDSVVYLAKEYHLDGFRFDLMGLHDVETMNFIRKALNDLPNGEQILVYGEPWSARTPAMPEGIYPADKAHLFMLDKNIAIFSDDTRDAIKGSVFLEADSGYVNGKPELASMIPHAVRGWETPSQIISYVSAHDNFTLYDKLILSTTQKQDFISRNEAVIQMNKLCAGIIFTCCGSVFFQAGEEFARTKRGIGDSFSSPPELNMLDWKRAYEYIDLVEFYEALIAFRKTIPVFMSKEKIKDESILFLEQKDPYLISFVVQDENKKQCFIVYNPNEREVDVALPDGEWSVVCDGTSFVKENHSFTGRYSVMAKSVTILRT